MKKIKREYGLKIISFLCLVLLFNGKANGQFWKIFQKKPTANELKLDSLEDVINYDREYFQAEILRFHELTLDYNSRIDSLNDIVFSLNNKLDSIHFATIEKQKKDSIEIAQKDVLYNQDEFCPEEHMQQQVKYLQECCCLVNDRCPNNISEAGMKVIRKGYEMAVETKDIVRGSCWDFINLVYKKAGYSSGERKTVFKGKKSGKFANPSILEPGDWIYHVNYSYHNVGHSAIFVCWKDYNKKEAITLSYVGGNKARPGKFGVYDLRGVYNVMRAK